MEVVIDTRKLELQLAVSTKRVQAAFESSKLGVMRDIAKVTKKTASVDNAPISPTQTVINRRRKTRRKTTRKTTAVSRTIPGGLMRSITTKADSEEAIIFVPQNSEAGKYASKIHDLKNKPGGWKNRGPGTVAKGPEADEKFISRAIDKHNENGDYSKIIWLAMNKAKAVL